MQRKQKAISNGRSVSGQVIDTCYTNDLVRNSGANDDDMSELSEAIPDISKFVKQPITVQSSRKTLQGKEFVISNLTAYIVNRRFLDC